jgi:hypothetical protein
MSLWNENLVLIVAVILIAASIPIVWLFDRVKSADHIARSLVAMGVGLLAAFVAVTVFELNAQKLEADRNVVLQQAKRSKTLALVSNLRFFAIEYGFAAYQIHATRSDCSAGATGTAAGSNCREAASYTANVARLVPGDYPLITSLSETSNAFAKSLRMPTILTDAEVSIKARLPVVIENYLVTSLNASQTSGTDARDRFLRTLSELESVAEDASTTLCALAASLVESEAKLDASITALELALTKGQEPIRDIIQINAKNKNMGEFECSNPRAQIERILPGAGAGNEARRN